MTKMRIIDAVTRPGMESKPNEDRLGYNQYCAFVIDGATGLGNRQIVNGAPSDAAWLAELASNFFQRNIDLHTNTIKLFQDVISKAQQEFVGQLDGGPAPRYSWPSASVAMIKVSEESLDFVGLGDCYVYTKFADGRVSTYTALDRFGDWESDQASKHVQRLGGMQNPTILDDQETLEYLREIRSLQNTEESNIWTLGLVEEAAQNLSLDMISSEGTLLALICSDGFAALVEDYKKYTVDDIINESVTKGLDSLMDELRYIEEVVDPQGSHFPRFKRSDDATAMLVQVTI